MYPIDSSVAALFEAENVQVLRITGTDKNGVAINITDEDIVLNSFNIDRYSCNGERLEIGTAIAAEMDLKLNNESGAFDSIVFEGTELFVEIGVSEWTQDEPTVHYIPIGYFTPDEQPRRMTTINLKALDRMVKFDSIALPFSVVPWTTENGTEIVNEALETIYFQVGISFPTTVANLVDVLCDQCGVTLAESIGSLPNADFVLANFPSVQQDITMRNLLQWCAGIMGTNAWIDWNGELRFSWYNNATDYVSTIENRYSSDIYENDITITGVKYTNTQNATIVSGSDDYALDMTGNYLAAAGIAEILPNVRDAVSGFSYRAFEASTISAPWLWPMDVIAFVDKEGNDHTCVLTNVAFGLNGTTALAGEGETQQSNKSKKPSGVTKEQSFLIESATQVTKELDESLDQEGIFNRLTNNGQTQGIYLKDGKLYINGTYIDTGTLNADLIRAGVISDASGKNYWVLDGNNSEFVTKKGKIGDFQIESGSLQYGSQAVGGTGAYIGSNGISYNVTADGNLIKTEIFAQGIRFYWNNVLKSVLYLYTNGLTLRCYDEDGAPTYPFQVSLESEYTASRSIDLRYPAHCHESLVVDGDMDEKRNALIRGNLTAYGTMTVYGTKSRQVSTGQYSDRLLYCYETPSPLFGDVGEGVIAEDGRCHVWLDAMCAHTIAQGQYQVFLQAYGAGECRVTERGAGCFIVEGTPGLRFGWEIKAKQRDFDQLRLDTPMVEYERDETNYGEQALQYLNQLKERRLSE